QASGVPGGSPLFTSLFNYRHTERAPGRGAGTAAPDGIRTVFTQETTNYPVAVSVDDLGTGFAVTVDAVRGADAHQLCELLLTCLDRLADALADTPGLPVADVDVLGAGTWERLLEQGRGPRAEVPAAVLPELLAERVCVGPDAVAVVAEDGE
ncbi:hypothetical protein H0H10_03420, partial [Streptomyces sp. TRM S81-3]